VAAVVEYRRRMEDYADTYGTALRTVKRWARIGRDAGDMCPLDDPEQMPAWWTRNMKQRVPPGLWVGSAPAPVQPDLPAATPSADTPEHAVPSGRGVVAELDRLEHLAAVLSVAAQQPGQAKAYLDAVQRMTALTRQVREEGEKARNLLSREFVEQALHDLHGPIEREIRLMGKTLADYFGLAWSGDFEERWNRECDLIFARLQTEVLK
jgi:hypothetical protein